MLVVCMHCNRVIKCIGLEPPVSFGNSVSHGVCEGCTEKVIKEIEGGVDK